MLTHIYTGFSKEQLHNSVTPSYIRLLGMSMKGQAYLGKYKKKTSLYH